MSVDAAVALTGSTPTVSDVVAQAQAQATAQAAQEVHAQSQSQAQETSPISNGNGTASQLIKQDPQSIQSVHDPTQHLEHQSHDPVHYAANGLQVLQAATDAQQMLQTEHDVAAVAAAAVQQQNHAASQQLIQQQQLADSQATSQHQQLQHMQSSRSDPAAQFSAALGSLGAMQTEQDLSTAGLAAAAAFHAANVSVTGSPLNTPTAAPINGLSKNIPMARMMTDHSLPQQSVGRTRDSNGTPKLTRLSRACDHCSERKVKCEQTRPCRPCIESGLECTNSRERKRRGPPNKSVKRIMARTQQQGQNNGLASQQLSLINLGQQAAAVAAAVAASIPIGLGPLGNPNPAATAASLAAPKLDAEMIAPMPVLKLLVDDFFTYVHPLCPFPHEPTFQNSLVNREDRTNPEFLALLTSMIGALVASFPRNARAQLKGQVDLPRAIVFIEKCGNLALAARGAMWHYKNPKTIYDACTSYFLALAASYTFRPAQNKEFLVESLSILERLGDYKTSNGAPQYGTDTCAPNPMPFNHINDQMGKRLFWCAFLGVRSMRQLGTPLKISDIPPPTPNNPYPDLPENTEDKNILATSIDQEMEPVTMMTGFRIATDIYMTMNPIVAVEHCYGMATLGWAAQREMIKSALSAVKDIVLRLPLELQVGHTVQGADVPSGDALSQFLASTTATVAPPSDATQIIKTNPARRRQLQFEIQKANIYVSELATRSYFVEMYFSRRNIHMVEVKVLEEGDDKDEERDVFSAMLQERRQIVTDLKNVLASIHQLHLEPNGSSLINKIRQVASTLTQNADSVSDRESLHQLVQVLMRLENTAGEDEESELRVWADLREYREQFVSHGGFAGNY